MNFGIGYSRHICRRSIQSSKVYEFQKEKVVSLVVLVCLKLFLEGDRVFPWIGLLRSSGGGRTSRERLVEEVLRTCIRRICVRGQL